MRSDISPPIPIRISHCLLTVKSVDGQQHTMGPVSNRCKRLFFHHGADVLNGPYINASSNPSDASTLRGCGSMLWLFLRGILSRRLS
jgi:hypothetical protein